MGLTFYEEVTQQQREQTNGEKYAAEVVALPGQLPTLWADPTNEPYDGRRYATVTIHCTTAPGIAYTIESGPTAETCIGKEVAKNNSAGIALVTTINVPGEYQLDGGVFVKLAGGAGGVFYIAGRS